MVPHIRTVRRIRATIRGDAAYVKVAVRRADQTPAGRAPAFRGQGSGRRGPAFHHALKASFTASGSTFHQNQSPAFQSPLDADRDCGERVHEAGAAVEGGVCNARQRERERERERERKRKRERERVRVRERERELERERERDGGGEGG